ncbi:hypothetical protein HZ994_15065 [Akkermansiaceae bacterium]|nr:hypothetical protein HZ994_15065 [Akkermansiaceae bacterium]
MTVADVFAVAMLGTIFLSFSVILILFACMARNASRRDAGVDNLLDELERDEKSAKQVKAASRTEDKREAWEKDGDWWKE